MQIKEIIDERREYVKLLVEMLPQMIDIEQDFIKELRLMQFILDKDRELLREYQESKKKYRKIKDQIEDVEMNLKKYPLNELYIKFEIDLKNLYVHHKIILKKNKMKLKESYESLEIEIVRHISSCIFKIKAKLEKNTIYLQKRQKVKYQDSFLFHYCENWQKKEINKLDELVDSLQLLINRANDSIIAFDSSISTETMDFLGQGVSTNHISMLKNAKVFSDYKNIEKYLRNFDKLFPDTIALDFLESIYKNNMQNYYVLSEDSIPMQNKSNVLFVSDSMLKESFHDIFQINLNSNFFASVKTKEKLLYLQANLKSLIQYLGEHYQNHFNMLDELKNKKKKLQAIAKTEDQLTFETIKKWLEKDKSLFFKEIFEYIESHPFFYDDELLLKN